MIGVHTMLETEGLGLEVTTEKLDLTDDNPIAVIYTRGKSSQRIAILELRAHRRAPSGFGS